MNIERLKKKKKTATINIRVEEEIKSFVKKNNLDSSKIFQERVREIMEEFPQDNEIEIPTFSSSFSQPSS